MACIDKTYVNKEQYIQARQFWLDTYAQQKEIFGSTIWLYNFSVYNQEITKELIENNTKDISEFITNVLWNTSFIYDTWLAQNCNLPFIQTRLKEQYGEHWWAFNKPLDFSQKCWLVSFKRKGSEYYGFYNIEEDVIKIAEKILVYGSTEFLKVFEDVIRYILWGIGRPLFDTATFEFFGNIINVKGGEYIWEEDGSKISISFAGEKNCWHIPEIIHSWDLEDANAYDPHFTILCNDEDEFYDILQFKPHKLTLRQLVGRQLLDYLARKYMKNEE